MHVRMFIFDLELKMIWTIFLFILCVVIKKSQHVLLFFFPIIISEKFEVWEVFN